MWVSEGSGRALQWSMNLQSAKKKSPNQDMGYIYPLPMQLAVMCWKQFKTGPADSPPPNFNDSKKCVRDDCYRARTVRQQGADRPPYKLKNQSNWPWTVCRQKVFSNPQNTVMLERSAERSASQEMNRGQSSTKGRTVRR
jgi:hypothetical protein